MVNLTLINSDYCEEPTRQSLYGSYPFEDPDLWLLEKRKLLEITVSEIW